MYEFELDVDVTLFCHSQSFRFGVRDGVYYTYVPVRYYVQVSYSTSTVCAVQVWQYSGVRVTYGTVCSIVYGIVYR